MDNIDIYDVNNAFKDVVHEKKNNNEFQRREAALYELNRCCNADDLEKLVSMAHSKDINKLYGIKKRWDELRDNKCGSKPRYRTDINTLALADDYARGMNANQLAKKYNCSYTLVVERLKEFGCYKGKRK